MILKKIYSFLNYCESKIQVSDAKLIFHKANRKLITPVQ